MPLTDVFQYRYTDTGVLLNADPPGDFVDINRVAGLDNAPYRETYRDREGGNGGFVDAEFEKTRSISLEGTVYSTPSEIALFLDQLKENYAPGNTPQPFYFSPGGVGERLVFAKALGVKYDWTTALRTGTTPVKFELAAEDPRIYDAPLQTVIVPLGTAITTGFGFSLGFPFGFGGTTGAGDGANAFNAGSRETPAILTITGDVAVDPLIVNDSCGCSLQFGISLAATDILTIDLANKTVVLNGVANRRNALIDPQWFMLMKGDNFLRYRAASAGPGSQLTVEYRHARR